MGHDPTEHVQEEIHHHAAHGDEHEHGHHKAHWWITAAALTAAFLAAFAAVSSSLATKHLTQSTLKRIEANDNWSHFDSKSIKLSNIDSRDMAYNVAQPAGVSDAVKKQHESDLKKRAEYTADPKDEKNPADPQGMKGIALKAGDLEAVSKVHLETHETYELSATMFHIAIAVVAIAVVAKRKEFWYMSIVGGAVGIYFFGAAIQHAPAEPAEHETEAAQVTSGTQHASETKSPTEQKVSTEKNAAEKTPEEKTSK